MYSLRGDTVQLRRRDCSVSAAGVFSLKRSGCTTPVAYATIGARTCTLMPSIIDECVDAMNHSNSFNELK